MSSYRLWFGRFDVREVPWIFLKTQANVCFSRLDGCPLHDPSPEGEGRLESGRVLLASPLIVCNHDIWVKVLVYFRSRASGPNETVACSPCF